MPCGLWNHRAFEGISLFEQGKYLSKFAERAAGIDNAPSAQDTIGKKFAGMAHVTRPEMERREQGQVVVVHAAGIDAKRGSGRASTEEYNSPAATHTCEGVPPSGDMTGAFDDEIRTVTIIESGDGSFGINGRGIDHKISAEFSRTTQTTGTTPSDDYFTNPRGFEHQ